jgi:hypothetical protein
MKHTKPELKPKELAAVLIFFFLMFFITAFASKCNGQTRAHLQVSAGITKKVFAVELHTGVIDNNNITYTVGFNALPHAAAPVLFQTRIGYLIANRVHVYAGAVRVTYSADDKARNYNTYAVGATVHIGEYYDRGGFYLTAGYSPAHFNVGLGMSFNLIKMEQ